MTKNSLLYSITKISYIHSSKHLTQKQVKTLFYAGEKAYQLGCPLNRFITIHFDDLADKKRPQKFVTDLLSHIRKWSNRRGVPVAYLYTLENSKTYGIHVHLLIHMPSGKNYKEFKKALSRWLPFEAKSPRIVYKIVRYPTFGNLHPKNGIFGITRYICKGIDPSTPTNEIRTINQGAIMGRRWGISKSLRLKN